MTLGRPKTRTNMDRHIAIREAWNWYDTDRNLNAIVNALVRMSAAGISIVPDENETSSEDNSGVDTTDDESEAMQSPTA